MASWAIVFSILKPFCSEMLCLWPPSISYPDIIKSLTSLSEFALVVITYLNETSVLLASISRSKYPSAVGAITPLAILLLPLNTGVIILVKALPCVISLLLTVIFHLAIPMAAFPSILLTYLL